MIRARDDSGAFTVKQVGPGLYRVSGKRIERVVSMTFWEYEDAVARFQRQLEGHGITSALVQAGVQPGDTVVIGDTELVWGDQEET